MTSDLIRQLKAARRVSVPLVVVVTPDPAATEKAIVAALPPVGTKDDGAKAAPPVLAWDVVDGLRAVNEEAKTVRAALVGDFDGTVGNPLEALRAAARMPKDAVLFTRLADRWWADPSVVQATANLRDRFKADSRMLVMLAATAHGLPPELAGDVVALDEPLPDPAALKGIVLAMHEAADKEAVAAKVEKAVEAVQGLPAFQAEQVVAMSLGKAGLDVDALWERKRKQIELTPGLKVQREDVRYADVGGVPVVKDFLKRILAGRARPNAVVFVDEVEKFLGGTGGGGAGDSSGVSQDQLGQLLAYMQDHGAAGCIFVGPPGSAKSMVAKATGNEAGIPTIALDLGGMKGSLVGQSEQNLRSALKVIDSVSNGRSLWIATCNAIADLPPELRRRFTLGTYFFDLPTAVERKDIWKLWLKKLDLISTLKGVDARTDPGLAVNDAGWTGAEIRQCCDIAWRLGCTLAEASAFVVPVSRSAADQLAKLRRAADGRFLSASRPGVYSADDAEGDRTGVPVTANGRRRIATED